MLTGLDILVGHVLEHQRIGIALEASHRSIRGDLVEKEEAPVVSIGHGELSIGQSKPVEYFAHHLTIVVHQCIGLPTLGTRYALLEHL